MKRFTIDGNRKCGIIFVVDTNYGTFQSNATSPYSTDHFFSRLKHENKNTIKLDSITNIDSKTKQRKHINKLSQTVLQNSFVLENRLFFEKKNSYPVRRDVSIFIKKSPKWRTVNYIFKNEI